MGDDLTIGYVALLRGGSSRAEGDGIVLQSEALHLCSDLTTREHKLQVDGRSTSGRSGTTEFARL